MRFFPGFFVVVVVNTDIIMVNILTIYDYIYPYFYKNKINSYQTNRTIFDLTM